jgi:ubiquinone/menaquinone biosynthesis C-methylase UbiE
MQQRIEKYWDNEALRYSESIQREMTSFKKEAWMELINANLPLGNTLKVLDIGTDPGFFAMILSAMGHRVTAIDCTDNMLAEAGQNTREAGFEMEFHKMDSHTLSFTDDTFDLLLCRNLTWSLRDPQGAY